MKIHMPTEEENRAAMDEYFQTAAKTRKERREACAAAMPALERLAAVMCERSGQPYKIRALLYSLWNGKPASLGEVVSLDWELHKDIAAVILAYGYEDAKASCFYDAIKSAVTNAGQWEWFLEERFEIQTLKDYVKGAEQR